MVILDQSTKAAAQQLLSDQHRASKAVVRLQVVLNNHGGIGQLAVPRVLAISVGGIAIAIGVAMVAFTGPFSATTLLGLGMSIGGGLSNIGDLALRGRIVDFVAIWRWPTFNLADVAICAGLVLTWIGLR